ncbi:MAG: lysophospholipid acyltransferase family protein [Gemmatimonas sp.]
MNAPRVTLTHRIEYAATRTLAFLLGLLGWRLAGRIGGKLARLAYWPFGIRRGVVERQIAAAFPEFTPERVREVARRSYDSIGRTFVEAALLPILSRETLLGMFESVEGWDLLQAARAKEQGVIVVTGHIGNWEIAGSYTAVQMPFSAVARRMANPIFDAYLTETRAKGGMNMIWDGDAVRMTPRVLRQNHVIAFLADQDGLGLASTFVPFFGRPAKTPRGPAVFALRLGTPMLFGASVRQPSGRYKLIFETIEAPRTGDRETDIDALVLAFTQKLEGMIRQYPEQYFWQHRRWRRQPPDTPPHLREP